MRASGKKRMEDALAAYLRGQVECGSLALTDPASAAVLFLQMITAQVHEYLLFESPQAVASLDRCAHVARVVQLFLYGAAPRPDPSANGRHQP